MKPVTNMQGQEAKSSKHKKTKAAPSLGEAAACAASLVLDRVKGDWIVREFSVACAARGSDGTNCTSTAPTQEANGERKRDELREELVMAAYKWNDLTDQELLVAF